MLKGISSALKGINGGYELNRIVGFFGGFVFIISTAIFMAHDVIWKGKDFDVTAYCLAFPAGIGAIVAAIAGAVSWKDNGVARARVTEQTGAIPVAPPDGPSVEPKRMDNEST